MNEKPEDMKIVPYTTIDLERDPDFILSGVRPYIVYGRIIVL